jgi:hypothetical protein
MIVWAKKEMEKNGSARRLGEKSITAVSGSGVSFVDSASDSRTSPCSSYLAGSVAVLQKKSNLDRGGMGF